MGQEILRKLDLAKNGILEKSYLYLLEFTFTNACAVQSKHGTNKIGICQQTVLKNMGN